jgi:ABC-type uncharacterized transport system permease subunit
MRSHSLPVAAAATLFIVGVLSLNIAIAGGQPTISESHRAENPLAWLVNAWPTVAIVVLAGLLLAGMVGLYDLDLARAAVLLAAIVLIVYAFYWQPLSQVFPR